MKITIKDIEIPIIIIEPEKFKKVYEMESCEYLGIARNKQLDIILSNNMHEFTFRNTLIHEAIHILDYLTGEMASGSNGIERVAEFISYNIEEIININKQVDTIMKKRGSNVKFYKMIK
jgi:hypothetical protein